MIIMNTEKYNKWYAIYERIVNDYNSGETLLALFESVQENIAIED